MSEKILGALFGLATLVGVAVLFLGVGLGLYGGLEALAGGFLTVVGFAVSFRLMGDD